MISPNNNIIIIVCMMTMSSSCKGSVCGLHDSLLLFIAHLHEKFDRVLDHFDERVPVTLTQLSLFPLEGRRVVRVYLLVAPNLHAEIELEKGDVQRLVRKVKRLSSFEKLFVSEKIEIILDHIMLWSLSLFLLIFLQNVKIVVIG